MRLTDLWKDNSKTSISFEFFPARNEKQSESLGKVIDELSELKPDFVSVTFGAGGSTREGSRQLVSKLKNQKKLEVVAHFAGYGLGTEEISEVLKNYKELGVETIFVVRGDPPRDNPDFKLHPKSFAHASDLLEYIGSGFDFCMGAAGYPEGHIEAINKEKDIEYLKLKVEKGANYIITNFCYDNNYFFDFVERCRKTGIKVPIIPGIMPIFNIERMKQIAQLCRATITEELEKEILSLKSYDKEAIERFGIEFALKQCRELIQKGVPGIHIYTMDRSKAPIGIINGLKKEGLIR